MTTQTKFIELRDRESGARHLVNIDDITTIREDSDGLAVVGVKSDIGGDTPHCLACFERYNYVHDKLVSCGLTI